MTTLGPIDAMLDKLTIESAKELGNGYVVYARGMAYVIDAVRAALSSLPTQAVGVKARTSAWLAYWPGAGSIDSVTRVTRSEHEAKRWRDDGAEVTELVERSTPSHPAAVGVQDEMVERSAAFLARQHPNSYASIDSTHVMVDMSRPNDHARTVSKRLLEAALRSTP